MHGRVELHTSAGVPSLAAAAAAAAVGLKSLIVSLLWTGKKGQPRGGWEEAGRRRRRGEAKRSRSFALQQVDGAHVLVQGLDAKAVAALAVESAALLDGCGSVGPLLPVLRGAQAAPLRLVLKKMRKNTTVKCAKVEGTGAKKKTNKPMRV